MIGDDDNGPSMIRNNTSNNCENIFAKSFASEFNSLEISHIDLVKIKWPEFYSLVLFPMTLLKKHTSQISRFLPQRIVLREEIRKDLSKMHI